MTTTTDHTSLVIYERYFRDWAGTADWGRWYPASPKINYTYEEGNTAPVIAVMQKRIERLMKKSSDGVQIEYKIVKVRKIKIVEDI
jgi:hypothetical protein